jgi:hypothetical protein
VAASWKQQAASQPMIWRQAAPPQSAPPTGDPAASMPPAPQSQGSPHVQARPTPNIPTKRDPNKQYKDPTPLQRQMRHLLDQHEAKAAERQAARNERKQVLQRKMEEAARKLEEGDEEATDLLPRRGRANFDYVSTTSLLEESARKSGEDPNKLAAEASVQRKEDEASEISPGAPADEPKTPADDMPTMSQEAIQRAEADAASAGDDDADWWDVDSAFEPPNGPRLDEVLSDYVSDDPPPSTPSQPTPHVQSRPAEPTPSPNAIQRDADAVDDAEDVPEAEIEDDTSDTSFPEAAAPTTPTGDTPAPQVGGATLPADTPVQREIEDSFSGTAGEAPKTGMSQTKLPPTQSRPAAPTPSPNAIQREGDEKPAAKPTSKPEPKKTPPAAGITPIQRTPQDSPPTGDLIGEETGALDESGLPPAITPDKSRPAPPKPNKPPTQSRPAQPTPGPNAVQRSSDSDTSQTPSGTKPIQRTPDDNAKGKPVQRDADASSSVDPHVTDSAGNDVHGQMPLQREADTFTGDDMDVDPAAGLFDMDPDAMGITIKRDKAGQTQLPSSSSTSTSKDAPPIQRTPEEPPVAADESDYFDQLADYYTETADTVIPPAPSTDGDVVQRTFDDMPPTPDGVELPEVLAEPPVSDGAPSRRPTQLRPQESAPRTSAIQRETFDGERTSQAPTSDSTEQTGVDAGTGSPIQRDVDSNVADADPAAGLFDMDPDAMGITIKRDKAQVNKPTDRPVQREADPQPEVSNAARPESGENPVQRSSDTLGGQDLDSIFDEVYSKPQTYDDSAFNWDASDWSELPEPAAPAANLTSGAAPLQRVPADPEPTADWREMGSAVSELLKSRHVQAQPAMPTPSPNAIQRATAVPGEFNLGAFGDAVSAESGADSVGFFDDAERFPSESGSSPDLFSALSDIGWSGLGQSGEGTPHTQSSPQPNIQRSPYPDIDWSSLGQSGEGTPHTQSTPQPNIQRTPDPDKIGPQPIDLYQALQQLDMSAGGGNGGRSEPTRSRPQPNSSAVQRRAQPASGNGSGNGNGNGNGNHLGVTVTNPGERRVNRAVELNEIHSRVMGNDEKSDENTIAIDFEELAEDVFQYLRRKIRIEFERRGRR